MPLASAALVVWLLEDGVWLLQSVAASRPLETDHGRADEARSHRAGPSFDPVGGHRRRTERQGGNARQNNRIRRGKAGKKIKGRKRHLLVDTQGHVIECVVTAASISDADGLKTLLNRYFAPKVQRLKKLWGDGGYRGEELKAWVARLKKTHKIDLQVVSKQGPGFEVLPRRWVVERTFAWLINYRVHAKDYEVLPCNSEAFIHIAMIHLILKRHTN